MERPRREPWVHLEDDDVLVVVKPAGVATHRPAPHAQDGMYEWVQRQRPQDSLAIVHRLDKATSGLLVFGRSTDANRSLTQQFEQRQVQKHYELVVERHERRAETMTCTAAISQTGRNGKIDRAARTDFERVATGERYERWVARPHTGRTHQVRVHADTLGLPIVGDDEHGDITGARLFLHASGVEFDHPHRGRLKLTTPRPAAFDQLLADGRPNDLGLSAEVALEARLTLLDPIDTNAYLWIDRHHDGFAGLRVERLGDVALVIDYDGTDRELPSAWIEAWHRAADLRSIYRQRRPRGGGGGAAQLVSGEDRECFEVTESGCRYLIDLGASATSTGLFLDQRDTRRRLLDDDLRGCTVLNAFGHTGSLSVAAASSGATTLTLDLSRRYLDWARENLRLNGIDPTDHDFVYGDALDWMDRFAKKGRTFDLVVIDPPGSSTTARRGSKRGGRWIADRDLHGVVERGARLVVPRGRMFVSTNLHRLPWEAFLEHLGVGLAAAGRVGAIETQTVGLDHRTGPGDQPYLKAAWITLDP